MLRYCVFDMIEDDGAPFETRIERAKTLLQGKKHSVWHPQSRLPEATTKDNKEDQNAGAVCNVVEAIEKMLKAVEANRGEGLMLRQPGSLYEKKRSNTLLKVKSFFDMDAVVTKIEKGAGKYKECMGALHCKDKTGNTFKVGTGFTDKVFVHLLFCLQGRDRIHG